MPCVRVRGGYKIRRSKGGVYPKIYPSLRACKIRVQQIKIHKGRDKQVK